MDPSILIPVFFAVDLLITQLTLPGGNIATPRIRGAQHRDAPNRNRHQSCCRWFLASGSRISARQMLGNTFPGASSVL